ncbi:MAG: regulatory protein RecX, partial [Psychrobacter sp.]
ISHQGETNKQTDNLPAALKAYLRTPEQRQAEVDEVKAESRLRWLAFYYLSRREYGKAELKQKLIDKGQEPEKIDALLDEFEEKGYQSDYRTTLMLIRENIRKGRGRGRIKQEFYRKKITMPGNIDELIDMANAESEEFSEFVDDSDDNLVEGVDWLKLAVIARTKKYGDGVPLEQKDKARQLRFLQYRGFNTDICFAALNYTLETLDERF